MSVDINESLSSGDVASKLLQNITDDKKEILCKFIHSIYRLYVDLHFTYLEINPLVVKKDEIFILDLAAKIDETARFLCDKKWGDIKFPPPFGREAYPEVNEVLILINSNKQANVQV